MGVLMLFTSFLGKKRGLPSFASKVCSLHLNIFMFIGLQFICMNAMKSQEGFPSSINTDIDERLFSKNDLKTKNYHRITCTSTYTKFTPPFKVDTIETYFFVADKDYEMSSYIGTDMQSETTDSCFFTYFSNGEVIKSCRLFVNIRFGDLQKNTMWNSCKYRYRNNKLLSIKKNNFLSKIPDSKHEIFDTIYYNSNNMICKSVSTWKGFNRETQIDSIIRIYTYDTLNNLTDLFIAPSSTFSTNFPPQKYNTYSLKAHSSFKYNADTIIQTQFNYYDYLPVDSFATSVCQTVEINDSCGFLVEQISSESPQDCDIYFRVNKAEYLQEYRLGEVKNITFVEQTKLPSVIYIADRFGLKIYYFNYQ